MTAGNYDFTIEQGANLNLLITLYDANNNVMNLTGYSARMMAKKDYSTDALITLNTDNTGIVLGGTAGTVNLVMSATATSNLITPSNLIYDLEIQDGTGFVTRVLEGNITISPEVTK